MTKQGLMVVIFNGITENCSLNENLSRTLYRKLSELPEFSNNYELFVFHDPRLKDRSLDIQVFPYKDYVFDIDKMKPSEIEDYLQEKILHHLRK